MPSGCLKNTINKPAKAIWHHQSPAIVLQQILYISNTVEAQQNDLKTKVMKIIEVLKEKMIKSLKGIQENTKKPLENK